MYTLAGVPGTWLTTCSPSLSSLSSSFSCRLVRRRMGDMLTVCSRLLMLVMMYTLWRPLVTAVYTCCQFCRNIFSPTTYTKVSTSDPYKYYQMPINILNYLLYHNNLFYKIICRCILRRSTQVRAIPFSKAQWVDLNFFFRGYLPQFNFVDPPYLCILNSILHLETFYATPPPTFWFI